METCKTKGTQLAAIKIVMQSYEMCENKGIKIK
jgi:hypothetical protein